MSDGISGFGTTLSGATTGAVAQIRSISLPGMEVGEIDVTTMASTSGWAEFVAGIKNAGEITLDLLYFKTLHNTLLTRIGAAVENWTITFPDSATFVVAGYISSIGIESPHDDAMTMPVTIKLSGVPAFTP